jgi:E3 ubiquitin-protein ligase TRIP12
VGEYVKLVVDAIVGVGLQPSVRAFKEGFSTVFPVSDLKTFSVEELVMMFGNADEDWGIESVCILPGRQLTLKHLQL